MNATDELTLDPEEDFQLDPDDAGLEIVPDSPAETPAVPELPAPVSLMEVLPADFPLPALIHFVPDLALRKAIDESAHYAMAIEVSGADGLQRADVALTAVKQSIKAAEAHFEEPKDISNRLHKNITTTLAAWLANGKAAVSTVGSRIYAEQKRLQALDDERRRKEQAEADKQAREEAQRRSDEAKKAQAPAIVQEQLKREAETAKAPPVPLTRANAPALTGSTIAENWTPTIAGTPRDAEQNPDVADLSDAQRVEVLKLLKAIIDGRAPMAAIALDWSYLRKRAKADKSTLVIPGIEAYDAGSVRSKPSRGK